MAIRDAQGKMTPRQVFNVAQFAKYGWKIDKNTSDASDAIASAAPNPGTAQKAAQQATSQKAADPKTKKP